jgi:flavin-dependent dehydrogenase
VKEALIMATDTKTYTIIFSEGNYSQTVKTGLSFDEARSWLRQKAAETGQELLPDLTVEQDDKAGGGAWTAVPAE